MRVIVTGGTGFVGSPLCARLLTRGHDVWVLTRDPESARTRLPEGAHPVSWAPDAADWIPLMDGADGIVNLAGEPVAQRWTARARVRIVTSRVGTAERLCAAIGQATRKPGVVVNASAVGYYGPRGEEELTEESAPGRDFLADTCLQWEEAARRMESLGPRVVRIRVGIVLSRAGGALARMLLPFKLGLGGPLGSGQQWMSWIHRDDLVALFVWALEHSAVAGALNGTAPNPVRMREFSTTLGQVLGRPSVLRVPGRVLKLLLGEMSTIVVDGQRVRPKKAESLGFPFAFPHLKTALRDAVER